MSVSYLPVMLSIDHPYPELEQWVAARFEMLNGRRVRLIHKEDLVEDAVTAWAPYAFTWLWDIVPEDTERILFVDSDIVPLRPLPELPDAAFVAAPDAQKTVDNRALTFPFFERTGSYFNRGFWVARRDTQPTFELLKAFAVRDGVRDAVGYDFMQTVFNLLIQASHQVAWLPHACNTIMTRADLDLVDHAIGVHFCGMPSRTAWVVMNALRSAIGLSKMP